MKKALGYDYGVVRESLTRADGTDTQYDAIYREEDGQQLSVVSRDYQLITHKEAMDFVFDQLGSMGIKYQTKRIDLTNQAKRMHYEIEFPEEEFDIPGDESTGTPTIKVQNSIDRSRSFNLGFGAYRVICTNGLTIGTKLFSVAETHYLENIKFKEIGPFVRDGIDKVRIKMKDVAERLLSESADSYFRSIVENMPTLFVSMTAEELKNIFEWEVVVRGGIEIPNLDTIKMVQKGYTAYELLQVLTAVATHKVTSSLKRQQIDLQIARLMQVA